MPLSLDVRSRLCDCVIASESHLEADGRGFIRSKGVMRGKGEMQAGGRVTRRKFIEKSLIAGTALSVPWFLAGGSSWAMLAPADDARAAFDKAVKAFNDKLPDVLGPLLDLNVELRKVHTTHARPVISGRQSVIDYLKGAWNGTPPVTMIFTPYSDAQQPVVKIHGPNDSVAVVTGLACWHDNDGDKADGELSYKFQLSNTSGAWLVTSLYGTYTGNPPKPCA